MEVEVRRREAWLPVGWAARLVVEGSDPPSAGSPWSSRTQLDRTCPCAATCRTIRVASVSLLLISFVCVVCLPMGVSSVARKVGSAHTPLVVSRRRRVISCQRSAGEDAHTCMRMREETNEHEGGGRTASERGRARGRHTSEQEEEEEGGGGARVCRRGQTPR